jgi:hypothetical protein
MLPNQSLKLTDRARVLFTARQLENSKRATVAELESVRCPQLSSVRYVAQVARLVCITYAGLWFLSIGFSTL